MKTDSKFWDKTSKKYSLKPVPSQEIYEAKLQKTQKTFNSNHSSVVMEFGCGTGTTALIHSPLVQHIDAYDFSPEMIKIAEGKKVEKGISNVHFVVKDVSEIDFKPNHYDVIMGHSILHLTFDNESLLKKIFTSLKPGGVFVSGSGCMKDMAWVLGKVILPVLEWVRYAPPINHFSADELIALHRQVGFEIAEEWRYKPGELFLIAKKPTLNS